MTPRDVSRIRHMLLHAEEAIGITQGRSRSDLDSDRLFNLAMVRLLEIVGEAATKVSKSTQESQPSIPWASISALRHRLIHGYDAVDFDIVWEVVQVDLPDLIDRLRAIISSSRPPDSL